MVHKVIAVYFDSVVLCLHRYHNFLLTFVLQAVNLKLANGMPLELLAFIFLLLVKIWPFQHLIKPLGPSLTWFIDVFDMRAESFILTPMRDFCARHCIFIFTKL